MKKLSFYLMSLIFVFVVALTVVMTSCENFLDGSDVQEKLSEMIDVANAKSYTIIVSPNDAMGTFLSSGDKECKVGYTIDLQFTVNTENYIYNSLEAVSKVNPTKSRADYVEFIEMSSEPEEKSGIFKVQVKLIKESDDIMIRPNCTLIPKVTQITPDFTPSGYDQDELVQIKFNKPVDPESFGNCECVSIFSDSSDLKDEYFETPKFIENNTILVFAPKQDVHMLTPDSGKKMDITVSISFEDEKDAEGIPLSEGKSHSYRINDTFGNQEISTILIKEDDNSLTGTFDKTGELKCTVGYSIALQFTVKKSDYLFDGLVALSRADGTTELSDVVEFSVLKGDADTGIYTVAAVIKKQSDDILIKPKCILLPKVEQITPDFIPTGYEQDETITIKFNKPVDPDSFGTFGCLSIFSDSGDLKSFFDTPTFADENTLLKITTKKGLHIITPDTGKKMDITVSLDFANVKDIDGISFLQNASHTYRINDSFGSQRKSKIMVRDESNGVTGSFDKTGEIECTVGYSIDLQFTVKKSEYIFDGLLVLSREDGTTPLADTVDFETLKSDDDTGIYTIRANIKKESDDILIKPKCILIPKVLQITPELNPSGYDQDTVVQIKFNKSINPETLTANNISIFSTDTDLKKYFDDFYFTEENTVLNLAPKHSKHIITPDSGKRLDITVNADLKNVSDVDGISIGQAVTHTYRINDSFKNQKKSKILVQEDANAATGTFDRKGEIECTVGCSVDLQFTVKKSDYLFDELIAVSRSDGSTPLTYDTVEFEELSADNEKGIYTVRVLIKKETNNILIKPKCILIPKVVQVTPELNPSGYEQDTVVQIKFNKAIDTETFDSSWISIFSSDTDLKNYFGSFYFTDEDTTLNIGPKANLHILTPDSGKRLDITVKADFSEMSDVDGISVDQKVSHTYRINDTFTNQKKSKILVQEDANAATGTFDRKGEIECTVGCSVDLQFTVNKSDYLFDELIAVSRADGTTPLTDEVEFEVLKRDANTGIYSIRVLIKQETNDILIKPKCILIPKIESIEPDYESSGCEQDSTISVVFNKPVDISAYFNPTITDASGNNLAEYFAQPYFSEDSTTLYIPTVKSKRLIDVNGSIETKDIIVKIDLSDISDKDGNAGTGVFQHKYRINKHLDSISPILTGVNLYSTSNKLSKYYKQLTPKAYDTWSNLGSNDGDFGTNHVKDSVYIEADGYDVDSGIGGIIVKEKILKYTDETLVNYDSTTAHLACTKDETTGKYYAEYKMETAYDGIVELEISVEDYAGNVNNSSQSKKFYVLKDTMVDTVNIRFTQELEPGSFPRENTEASRTARARRMEKIPVVKEDEQDVVLTINNELTNGKIGSEDYFYSSYHSPYEIEVYWGYSEDSATNRITKDSNNNYNFTRDISRFVFIKVLCRDEVGNEKVKIKRMPPRAEICAGEQNNEISITNLQSWVVQSGVSISQQTTYNIEDYSHLIFEFEDENVNPNRVIWCGQASPLGLMRDLCTTNYANGQYPTGNVKVYASANVGDFPSPLSLNYVSFSITGWDADGFGSAIMTTPVISNETDGEKTVVQGYGPEGTDYISREPLKVTYNPMQNTGCNKVVIDDYMTSAGQAAGITYSFYIMGWYAKENNKAFDPSFSSLNKSPELLLYSYSGYKIFVEAYDPSTNIIYRPFTYELDDILDYETGGYIKQNLPSFEFTINSETTTTKDLILRDDVLPPIVNASQNFNITVGIPGGFMINGPVDYYFDSFDESNDPNSPGYEPPQTLPVNEDGYYELTYYIIPNPSSDINFVPTYSIEELRTQYQGFKRTLEYNLAAFPDLIVPYGNLAEGFYTISFIVEDISGNAEVYTFAFVNYTLGKLPFTAKKLYNEVTQQQELKFSISENKRAGFTTTVNGEEESTISVSLATCMGSTNWLGGTDNIMYDWVIPENGQGEPVYTLTFEKTIEFDNNYPWRKVLAHTGFGEGNNSASGKAYFNSDYIYVGQNDYCQIKNCMEGLNGIQIFSDNSVLVHTMFSPDKLTDSKYSRNALSIWETKGAETGIMIYNTTEVNGVQQDINKTYDLSKLNGVPVGCWYTTIIRFADGTVVMTDIKQKY